MLCARECPDWCIYIDSHKETLPAVEGGRERQRNVLDRFAIDFSLCMYCGICIEVCPFDALFWSPEFEYAEFDIRDLLHEKERLSTWMDSRPAAARPGRRCARAQGGRREPAARPPCGRGCSCPAGAPARSPARPERPAPPAADAPTARMPAADAATAQLPAADAATAQLPAADAPTVQMPPADASTARLPAVDPGGGEPAPVDGTVAPPDPTPDDATRDDTPPDRATGDGS